MKKLSASRFLLVKKTILITISYEITPSGIKNALFPSFHFDKAIRLKRIFTSFFLILLLLTGVGQALAEDPPNSRGKIDAIFTEILSADFKSLYNPLEPLNQVSQIWKSPLGLKKGAENQAWVGTKPILYFGSIPEAILKYQSDTLLQWGYSLPDLILSLRLGLKTGDVKYLDIQPGRENNNLFHLHLNFNFLIDLWFK